MCPVFLFAMVSPTELSPGSGDKLAVHSSVVVQSLFDQLSIECHVFFIAFQTFVVDSDVDDVPFIVGRLL